MQIENSDLNSDNCDMQRIRGDVVDNHKESLNTLDMLGVDKELFTENLVKYQVKIEEILELDKGLKYKDCKRYLCEMVTVSEDLLLTTNMIYLDYFEKQMNSVLQRKQEDFDRTLNLAIKSMLLKSKEDVGAFMEDFSNLIYDAGTLMLEKLLCDVCGMTTAIQREMNLILIDKIRSRKADLCNLSRFAERHLFKYKEVFKKESRDLKMYFLESMNPLLLRNLDDVLDDVYNYLVNEKEQNKPDLIKKKEVRNYIASYRELNKIANKNNFEYIRSNGDHGIFKRFDGRTVVIPQGRDIGKGLSLKIQKNLGER